MGFNINNIEALLLIAAIVAVLVKKINLPYTVGLVITGGIIAMSKYSQNVVMTRELIFNILLPPLIFEASLFLPWIELRKDLIVIIIIATFGVILAACLTSFGLIYFASWPIYSAWVFGILISATDPVSVIAAFKELGITGRLRILMEAESLFNDGTAAVLFSIILIISEGNSITFSGVITHIIIEIGIGILCGLLIGILIVFFAKQINDRLVELTLTTIAAYGSFILAEHFHASGILASLTSGLIFGNLYLRNNKAIKNNDFMELFWEYAAFVANSLIFLLIGIHIAHQNILAFWLHSFIAIILVLFGRAIAVYLISLLFSKSKLRIKIKYQHIMFWGGLRGALALALALSIPEYIPIRDEIVTVTFAVVAFSVIVQGITMPWLIKYLNRH